MTLPSLKLFTYEISSSVLYSLLLHLELDLLYNFTTLKQCHVLDWVSVSF